MILKITINIIRLLILIRIVFGESFEEDSSSIELPNRPENRQAHKQAMGKTSQEERQNFLHLLSRLIKVLKTATQTRIDNIDNHPITRQIKQKTRKSIHGLRRAYSYAEKAKKYYLKHLIN